MKTKDMLLTIAVVIGLFVAGGWAFRVLDNSLSWLFWWFRYNGIYMIAAIAVLWIIGSVLFGRDKS
jgi:hypothetical protein